ncbi:MAG: CAP domain-containing protein [Bacteroidetes bacterium]|nr:CAP domain-containing protein [Bacteroidota bacterium]
MKNNKKSFIIIALIAIIYSGCSKDDKGNTTATLTPREQATKDYKDMYLTTMVSDAELAWTGNSANCAEGTISKTAYDRSLLRLNYFRKICGLSSNMVWNSAWHSDCQKAALMMTSNNSLSHFPPSTWKCYTTEGYNAAGISNIAWGSGSYHSSACIAGWVKDDGSNNAAAGHRRWILFSRAKEYGLGSTSNAAVLHCIEHTTDPLPSSAPTYVAYPPAFIPQDLVYGRWSLGIPNSTSFYSGVDFSAATVKMTDNTGADVTLSIISKTDNGYGDQTIVWEPQGIQTTMVADIKYHVVVDNVLVNTVTKKYEYDVTIFKP